MIVEVRQRPPAEDDDSRRRYYRLTPWGRQVAAAEAERMEKAIAAARVKRLLKTASTGIPDGDVFGESAITG